MKKNLIFIGMPAVGKSTVGIVVAKRLGMNFIDADLLIQEQEKKLLREDHRRCWTRWLSENRKSGKCRTGDRKFCYFTRRKRDLLQGCHEAL